MRALRLTELARDRDLHQPFHDRLMLAYWEEATNIGDPVELRRARRRGRSGRAEAVRRDRGRRLSRPRPQLDGQAHSIGITGIPAFLLDRRNSSSAHSRGSSSSAPWHSSSYVPSTLTARAATSRTVIAESPDPKPINSFARSVSGSVSVGLKAIEFVIDT